MSELRNRKGKGGKGKGKASNKTEVNVPASTWSVQLVLKYVVLGLCGATMAYYGNKASKVLVDSLGGTSDPVITPVAKPRFSPPAHIPMERPSGFKLEADLEKRAAVKEAFEWSWSAYEKHAFGADEFHPISQSGSNLTAAGGVGYTVVDSLDSLLVFGLEDEFKRAANWCREHLSFDRDANFNTFETTIRLLGGLLSAHHLASIHPSAEISNDAELFLSLATDLGDRLMGAFSSPSGIPWSMINLATRTGIPDKDNNRVASLAEAGSLQLELKYLSHLTGDYSYWKAAEKVTAIIKKQSEEYGIAPIFISPDSGQFVASEIRLGSRGDSYYEYLLKQWLQTNRQEPVYREMYDVAMGGIKKLLISTTKAHGLIYTHELSPVRSETGEANWQVIPKQDHLVCFLGGSFLLGITEGRSGIEWEKLTAPQREDYVVGKGIIETCMKTHDTATGLAPEIAMFYLPEVPEAETKDWYIKGSGSRSALIDGRNILRPETVESLFLAYRATGDEKYREWGWQIFQAFEAHCRIPTGGFASVRDVEAVPAELEDRVETFWLSETLKYLYLLFDDGEHIPLDGYVFNTEAHILPVFTPSYRSPFAA